MNHYTRLQKIFEGNLIKVSALLLKFYTSVFEKGVRFLPRLKTANITTKGMRKGIDRSSLNQACLS